MEANEPPEDAAIRELSEELRFRPTLRGLLVVDWVAPHGPWDDQLAFVFDGGTLDEAVAASLRPRDEELSEAVFVAPDEVPHRVSDRMRRRFTAALDALATGRPRYLRDGSPVA